MTQFSRTGRLVGVGVGPGDPRHLTLKAIDALSGADRVVAPSTAPDAVGRAEAILRQAMPELKIDRLVFNMASDGQPGGKHARESSHRKAAEHLLGWLDAGETIAFATLGDPNLYSTFSSLASAVNALRPGTLITTIPGITAFQDLASRTGTVLLDGTQSLTLVTALDGPRAVEAALRDPSRALVVYKGGRYLSAIRLLLEESGRLEGAVAGELLGLPGERVGDLGELASSGPAAYLVTVIVPPGPDRT
ncbi:MAG: precorrin-2 C(20)-methyltransferase [Actinobacteria bacterium]|nr:precorrin-2 C(20)-methyltransferase [Actinomycetota bacterium]